MKASDIFSWCTRFYRPSFDIAAAQWIFGPPLGEPKNSRIPLRPIDPDISRIELELVSDSPESFVGVAIRLADILPVRFDYIESRLGPRRELLRHKLLGEHVHQYSIRGGRLGYVLLLTHGPIDRFERGRLVAVTLRRALPSGYDASLLTPQRDASR